MKCSLARMLLAFPKADLAADDRAQLLDHVDACPACAAAQTLDAALHNAFAKAMQAVPVPVDLHDKLLRASFAIRGARHRRLAYQWSAMAAGLLLAVGIAVGGYWRARPEVNADAVAMQVERDWEFREAPVHEFLLKENLPAELPENFDYRYYSFHGKGDLAGRDTPVVVFQGQFGNETHTARVYIFESFRFKLGDILEAQSSFVRVSVKQHPTRPDISYVIVYTSETLEPFLKRVGPNA